MATVEAAIEDVTRMWQEAGQLASDSSGRVVITDDGFALEEATTRVGELIAARADAVIAEGMAKLRAEYGLPDDADLTMLSVPEPLLMVRLAELDAVADVGEQALEQGDKSWQFTPELRDTATRMRDSLRARREMEDAGTDVDELQSRIIELRSDAYLAALAEVREMGAKQRVDYEFMTGEDGWKVRESDYDLIIQESVTVFPSDWCERSRTSSTPFALAASDEMPPGYVPVGVLILGTRYREMLPTAKHEMTHRMQLEVTRTVDGAITHPIAELEEAFIQRRTGRGPGSDPQRQNPPVQAFDAVIYPDHFAHFYIGRDYPSQSDAPVQAREVLPMAVESMFSGTTGGLLGDGGFTADLEHRAFALGVLATVGR